MKRGMVGGATRGPVAPTRQRRTIRFIQGLAIVLGAVALLFAGYSWGRASGIDAARASGDLGSPRRPGPAQVLVLSAIGLLGLGTAVVLQGSSGPVMPTPARLDELAGRAEQAATVRAEEAAGTS